jgi:hypothetical protein
MISPANKTRVLVKQQQHKTTIANNATPEQNHSNHDGIPAVWGKEGCGKGILSAGAGAHAMERPTPLLWLAACATGAASSSSLLSPLRYRSTWKQFKIRNTRAV